MRQELVKRLSYLAALCGIVVGALVVVAACGGEEEQPPAQATPQARPTPDPDVALVQYESPSAGYSISYPEGWEVAPQGSLGDRFTWFSPGRAPLAEMIVSCYKGENQTPDGLIRQDAAAISGIGQIDPTRAVPIELAGIAGKQIIYTTSIAGFVIEHVAAYAVQGECGWRLGLSTYGQATLDDYLPLFQRMIASFQPD
ncbi:MAG: hypothetical protein WBF66_07185 [Dehalococcoidia bacterium]